MEEIAIYLFYDIRDDGLRMRVAEACKDYGLARIQFSGFHGALDRNMREELFLKISDILGDNAGRVLLLPVCEKDMKGRMEILNERHDDGGGDALAEG